MLCLVELSRQEVAFPVVPMSTVVVPLNFSRNFSLHSHSESGWKIVLITLVNPGLSKILIEICL